MSNQTAASARSAGPGAPLGRLVLGTLMMVVAAGSTGALVLEHFGGVGLPGCGAGGGCGAAAKSEYGSVPGLGLPTSIVGLAYFVAVLVGYLVTRGNPGSLSRWVARLGLLASIGFLVVSVLEQLLCPYCIVSHLANLAFVVILETTRRAPSGGGRPRASAGLWPALATFLVFMGVMGIAEANAQTKARAKAEQELRDSTSRMVAQGTADQNANAPDPTTPDPTTPDPTGADSTAPGEAAPQSGAPEVIAKRDEPKAIEPADATPAPAARTGFTGRYRLGPEASPVRIVIFSDYQCPECKFMEGQAMAVLAKHPQVSLSAKHFPFSTDCNRHLPPGNNKHPNACRAARATEAAGMVGGNNAFWEMHKWVFSVNGLFDDATLMRQVGAMGLDAAAFARAFNDPATSALVSGDIEEGMSLGVMFTPTVFINGVELRGTNASNALMLATEALLGANVPALTSANDKPAGLEQKVIDDWRASVEQREPTDNTAWSIGPADAPLHLMLWGDYREVNTPRADAILRRLATTRTDLRYTFRHYPFDQGCNMFVRETRHPLACRASQAAEVVGSLAGAEAYWAMHAWLMENQRATEQEIVVRALELTGLEQEAFLALYRGREVAAVIREDVNGGQRIGIRSLPTLMLNGRVVPRWFVGERPYIEEIINAAGKDAAPK